MMTLRESKPDIEYRPFNYNEIDINKFDEAEKEFIEYAVAHGTHFEDVYVSSVEYMGYAELYLQITERVMDIQEDYESKYKFDFFERRFSPRFYSELQEIRCNEVSLKFEEIYDYNRALILLKYADYLFENGLVKQLFPQNGTDLCSRKLTFEEANPQKVSKELFMHQGNFIYSCNFEDVRVPNLDWNDRYDVNIDIKNNTMMIHTNDWNGIGMGVESEFVSGFRPRVDRMKGMIIVGQYELYFKDEYDYNMALLYLRYGDYLYDNKINKS